jgi:phosphatidate cytidylyltransferase
MTRVATAVVLIPLVLALILRAPALLLALALAAVALLGVRELLSSATHYGIEPLRWPAYAAVVAVFTCLGAALTAQTQVLDIAEALLTLLTLTSVAVFFFFLAGMRRRQLASVFPAAAVSLVALLYVTVPLALLLVVRELWAGAFLLLYLLLVVWTGDSFAYYAGRAFGRHKLAPRISPGKTWEGVIASFAGAVAVGSIVLTHAPQISAWLYAAGLVTRRHAYLAQNPPSLREALILSAVINVAAQLGDLIESLIKRGAGLKDSGALLPGHGGILDRIDALLFAAPVLWYYAALRATSLGHF